MEYMLDSEIDDNSSLKKYLNEDNCERSYFFANEYVMSEFNYLQYT